MDGKEEQRGHNGARRAQVIYLVRGAKGQNSTTHRGTLFKVNQNLILQSHRIVPLRGIYMTFRSVLFKEHKMGALTLSNRIIMAPMTRVRCDPDCQPNALMAQYYAQRASAGLIITEATQVHRSIAFINEPGIYSQAQVEGWKLITEAVHAKKGKIALQLYHPGRIAHPAMNNQVVPVAPSAVKSPGDTHTQKGKLPHVVPRALSEQQIKQYVGYFKKAAQNAIKAGFDAVQIHAANGYLVNQFLSQRANSRTDKYGGSVQNRSRFLLEIVDAVIQSIGADRIGVRLSPLSSYNDCILEDPLPTLEHLCSHFNKVGLSFLHMMRTPGRQKQVLQPARKLFKGTVIANVRYTADQASEAISSGKADVISFGTLFIANPDLPRRFELDAPLAKAEVRFYYTGGAQGYTSYPPVP